MEPKPILVHEMYVVMELLVISWNNKSVSQFPGEPRLGGVRWASCSKGIKLILPYSRDSKAKTKENWRLLVGQFQHNIGKSFLIVRTVQNESRYF